MASWRLCASLLADMPTMTKRGRRGNPSASNTHCCSSSHARNRLAHSMPSITGICKSVNSKSMSWFVYPRFNLSKDWLPLVAVSTASTWVYGCVEWVGWECGMRGWVESVGWEGGLKGWVEKVYWEGVLRVWDERVGWEGGMRRWVEKMCLREGSPYLHVHWYVTIFPQLSKWFAYRPSTRFETLAPRWRSSSAYCFVCV